jgi:phage FluMu protein Com
VSKEYTSGAFCIDIKCPQHKVLEGLEGNAYIEKKQVHCKDCYAWLFFTWMKDNKWRIIRTQPELSNKQLAAMIKGIDPVRVEDLTEDEIMCL